MQGQANHFIHYAPEVVPYGQKRYWNETKRLISVLEDGLKGKDYLAAGRFTLADIANFTWAMILFYIGMDVDEFPNVKASDLETWSPFMRPPSPHCHLNEQALKGVQLFAPPTQFESFLTGSLSCV